MVLGTGIDVVPVARVRRELVSRPWADTDGIFRPAEIHYCTSVRAAQRRFALLFAAKEATVKALGVRPHDLSAFHEIEVTPVAQTTFHVRLHGRARRRHARLGRPRVLTSWHVNRYLATAMVILEG